MLARTLLVVKWYGDGGVDDTRCTRLATGRPDLIVTPSKLVETWVRERGADVVSGIRPEPDVHEEQIRTTRPR